MKKNSKLLLIIATALILVGGFLVLRPDTKEPEESRTQTSTSQKMAIDQTVDGKTYDLTITDGKLTGGQSRVVIKNGQKVNVTVTANTADELHLHGYDKEVQLEPGKASTLSFVADQTGQFEAELHAADSLIFILEVQP